MIVLADRTALGMIGYWHDNVRPSVCYILQQKCRSDQVNMKCPVMYTILQPWALKLPTPKISKCKISMTGRSHRQHADDGYFRQYDRLSQQQLGFLFLRLHLTVSSESDYRTNGLSDDQATGRTY